MEGSEDAALSLWPKKLLSRFPDEGTEDPVADIAVLHTE